MASTAFKPKAYVLEGCPFSFKLLLFLAEAQLLDDVDITQVDPDAPEFDDIRQKLARGTGKGATFPTVEIEEGRYMSDSDRLIEHFARIHHIDPDSLPALSFYKETIFPQLEAMHQ